MYSIGEDQMSLSVTIRGNADSAVAAAEQTGNALKSMEGVSEAAIASLTRAIEKLDIDFTKMGGTAEQSAGHVRRVGEASAQTRTLLEDMNRAGGAGARMFSALGTSAGEAAARVEAFTGVLDEMKALAPELIAIGAAIAAIGAAFSFVKDGIQEAEQLQESMDRLKAVVEEQKGSWSAASDEIKKFIEQESIASGISETQLAGALSELAGKIHDVHDAMVIVRVAEEESIATGKGLEEITNALLEAESGRGQTLAMLDPRLKNLIHDHADLHTILQVLHEDNIKAMEDADGTAETWRRVGVIFEDIREELGKHLLPMIEGTGLAILGMGNDATASARAIVDSFRLAGDAIAKVYALIHPEFATAGIDAAFSRDMADLQKQAQILSLPMTVLGGMDIDSALNKHNAAMSGFSLDNNPTVGFGTNKGHGSHGRGGSHSGKAGVPTLGDGQAVIQYDDSIKMTTRDQQKFTDALYASGDALGKQILALDKSRQANKQSNEDERATYGMSIEQQIAYYQEKLANLDKFDADYLQKSAELQNKLDDLQTQAYKKQYDDAQQAHQKQIQELSHFADVGANVMDAFFQGGKNGMKSFEDAWRQMLDQMLHDLERSALLTLLERMFGGKASFGQIFAQETGVGGLFAASGGANYSASSAAQSLASAGTYSSITAGNVGAPSSGGKGLFGISSGFGTTSNPGLGAYAAAASGGAMIGQTVFGGKGYADVGGAMGAAAALALAGPVGWGALAAMTLGGAIIGSGGGSLFGNHFDPANEPDIYQQDAWGQENADMTGGEWTANGKQYNPDSWTNQLTHNRGWNILMENFVQKFRGKTGQLPQNLQSAFSGIEALWGGASGQADFNHDGKDGYLDIGGGKRAKWSEFWSYIQANGPQIAQLMDNYQSADVYTSNSGMATMSGSYAPSGSPYVLHDFPDYGGGGSVPVVSGGNPPGGYTPAPGGGNPIIPPGTVAPNPGNGGPLGGGEGHNKPQVIVQQFISGSVLTESELYHKANKAIAQNAQIGHALRMNMAGKG